MKYITKLNTEIQAKRDQLKRMMDEFTSFSWRGQDAWEEYGAFIINNKEDLKFYNGPNFSNEYAKAQFSKNSQFLGVNYEVQKISFKIGVYCITEDQYRKFIYWLDPEWVDNLSFGFEEKYQYKVKLVNRQDSTRYCVGNINGEKVYYTEMQLNFEVQGEQCAFGKETYSMNLWQWQDNMWIQTIKPIDKIPFSDLSTPILADLNFNFSDFFGLIGTWTLNDRVTIDINQDINIHFKTIVNNIETACDRISFNWSTKNLTYYNDTIAYKVVQFGNFNSDDGLKTIIIENLAGCSRTDQETLYNWLSSNTSQGENLIKINQNTGITDSKIYINFRMKIKEEIHDLFNLSLKNIPIGVDSKFSFKYDGAHGLLFLKNGNSNGIDELVTSLNTTDRGEKIVDNFFCNKGFIPGLFEGLLSTDIQKIQFQVEVKYGNINKRNWFESVTKDKTPKNISRVNITPRTTLI